MKFEGGPKDQAYARRILGSVKYLEMTSTPIKSHNQQHKSSRLTPKLNKSFESKGADAGGHHKGIAHTKNFESLAMAQPAFKQRAIS